MLEITLRALSEHTELSEIMAADGGDCETVIAASVEAGIDVDALAAHLHVEGAKAFVKSWHELVGVTASKSAALAKAS